MDDFEVPVSASRNQTIDVLLQGLPEDDQVSGRLFLVQLFDGIFDLAIKGVLTVARMATYHVIALPIARRVMTFAGWRKVMTVQSLIDLCGAHAAIYEDLLIPGLTFSEDVEAEYLARVCDEYCVSIGLLP
jgi:hypothetical protein